EFAGAVFAADSTSGEGFWSQSVACKPDAYYRVEAIVECDLKAANDTAGFVLAIDTAAKDPPVRSPGMNAGVLTGGRRVTPGVHHAAEPIAIRAYFQAPPDVRSVEIAVGIVNASGTARVHDVRFIRILEPDELSHLLAVPPPGSHYTPPRVVHTVTICSACACTHSDRSVRAGDRPVRQILSAFFGESNVRMIAPVQSPGMNAPVQSPGVHAGVLKDDALLLPDATPPRGVRSLSALLALADERIIIISLPAFAALNRRFVTLRRIEQPDDPIHAKVVFSDHATRGFALHDVFAYAWPGREAGSFVQNQFRLTKSLKAFCRRHRFETLLVSSCDKDATSDHPICLYRRTRNGGLFVLDIEPLEAAASTFGEPTLAAHLLLAILGRHQAHAGQYTVPMRTEAQLCEAIREAANRWDHFVVHDDDKPASEVTGQLVTVGGEDQSYGLPLAPKPVILIRSGLRGGDVESVCGVLSWFRQLLRPEPNPCPYAQSLASRFRLAWVPCVSPWEGRDGWRRTDQLPQTPMVVESDGADVAALIDVQSCPAQGVRIVFARADAMFKTAAERLPRLFAAFSPGGCFAMTAAPGDAFGDRRRFAWRQVRFSPQVVAEPKAFTDDAHRDVIASGGCVIRIELPGCDADFVAHSIARTDLAASLVEMVIGLQYGMIAVNRLPTPVQLDGFPPIAPGDALIVNRPDLSAWVHAQAGRG
ncbi:MAG: hypothetical protein Q7R41_10235, partial [Phycisphaerales bacterium]|nr:hypothetical protein [Phycisphaerales bacterium]